MSNNVIALEAPFKVPESPVKTIGILEQRWRAANDGKRHIATQRYLVINKINILMDQGRTKSKAIKRLELDLKLEHLEQDIVQAIDDLSLKGTLPNRSTLYRWMEHYKYQGLTGLLPCHKGSIRQMRIWEGLAKVLFNLPSKPSMAAVARMLREDHGHNDASDSAVRKYIKSLPANEALLSGARLGHNHKRKTQKNYVHRSTEELAVGFLYQGDGHTIDVYLAHPETGKLYRPELTVWMDIKTRYIVGWWLSDAESSRSSIFSLSHAINSHDHVPAFLYIDNGSGFISKLMIDDIAGFYSRFDISIQRALPGNPGAKGQLERFFRTMEDDFGKFFGEAYCGYDIAEEVSNRFCRDVRNGKRQAPTLQEWKERFKHWLFKYHNRPHPEFKNTTPAALWATLKKVPVHTPSLAVCRPRKQCSVIREAVRLDSRKYYSPDLFEYNSKKVLVEHDLHNDSTVEILTLTGEWICSAQLILRQGHLTQSRMQDAEQKRLEGQIKRKQRDIEEQKARTRGAITAEAQVQALEQLDNSLTTIDLDALDVLDEEDEIKIDLFKTDY